MPVRCISPIKTAFALRLLRLLVLLQIGQGVTVWGQQIDVRKTNTTEFLINVWNISTINRHILLLSDEKIFFSPAVSNQIKTWSEHLPFNYLYSSNLVFKNHLDKPDAAQLQVQSRVHLTWLANILCLITLIVLIVWHLYGFRKNHILEKKKLKRIIQNLNHTIYVQKRQLQQQDHKLKVSNPSQDRFTHIANKMNNPLVICTLSGNLIWANTSFYSIFERTHKPTDVKLWEISGHDELEECFWNCLFNKIPCTQQIKKSEAETDVECLFQVTLSPVLTPTKKVKQIIAVYSNVTNLYELNRTRDMLMTVITHDLKSHLLAFKLIGETLLTQLHAENHPSVQQLNHLCSQASALYTFSHSLSDWLKDQRGKMHFMPEKFKLSQVVHEVIQLFKFQSQIKQIKFRNLVSDHLNISADYNMLKTILRNLFSNAIQHTQKGCIVIQAHVKAKNVIIKVIDEGLGEQKQDLFKSEHTGFGLFICEEFIRKNNGEIWQEAITNGTCIAFTLPLATTQMADIYEKENYNCR